MATRPATAKKAPAKTAAPAAVVSLKSVFEQLGEAYGLPKKQVHALQAEMVSALTEHLKDGARIRVAGLGTLEVRNRAARTGRNPATGEAIEIAASRKIAFRPAKELKEAV